MHGSSVWRKSLSYNFHTISKKNRKKLNLFCGFLRTVEKTGDKKTALIFSSKKMFTMQFLYKEIVWQTFFDGDTNILKNCFKIFFQPQIEFCTQTKTFRKKTFLDAIIFASFSFHLYIFFQIRWNFLYGGFMYNLINVWLFESSKV